MLSFNGSSNSGQSGKASKFSNTNASERYHRKGCQQFCTTRGSKERKTVCKDCERDDPTEKFKRNIRTRIYNSLRYKNKTKHSVEYLGCSSNEYFNWIFKYNNNYNLDNYGAEWHIDHVIPLSKFDLNVLEEQVIAFNWRNTMPLSCIENLSKNNKILQSQVETHYEKIVEYHLENKLDLPQVYIDLFAKHLVVREVP